MANQQAQKSTQVENYEKIKKWLSDPSMKKILKKTLGENVALDPWVETALVMIRTNKKLMQCTPMSMMGALMTLASMGLRLENALGQAYLEAYSVKEKDERTGKWEHSYYEAQAGVGYRGLIDLVYRAHDVLDVECVVIHKNDTVDFRRGSNPFIHHTWDHSKTQKERGPISAMYTGIRYKAGYYSFEIYPFEDLKIHRNKVLAQKNVTVEEDENGDETFIGRNWDKTEYKINPLTTKNPWIAYDVAMYKKSCIRWSSKFWNLSPDIQRAAHLASLEDAGLSQGLTELAKATLPAEVKAEAEADVPSTGSGKLAPAQSRSVQSSENLADQMAAEALAMKNKKTAEIIYKQPEEKGEDRVIDELKKSKEKIEKEAKNKNLNKK